MRRFPAVFLFVPFTRPAKLHARAVDNQTHGFAIGQTATKPLSALPDTECQRSEPVTQMTEAGHGNVEPADCPELFHLTRDLAHAPAEQPVERIDQLDVGVRVGRFTSGHALHIRVGVDEQRFQVAIRAIQAELAASLQALVVRACVRYPVARFLALVRLARLQSGIPSGSAFVSV
jgi:hypothetical protein